MHFLTIVTANLFGRPVRSLLTISGVALAVGAVVSLVGVAGGFERSLREAYEGRGVDLLVSQAGKLQQTSSILPEELGEQIAALPGVKAIAPALSDAISLIKDDLFGVMIQAWPADSFLMEQLTVVDGKPLTSSGNREIIIGKKLAEVTQSKVGDTIDVLEDEPFTVAGIIESTNVFENGAIYMPLADLQKLMLREGEVTAIAVAAEATDLASVQALQTKIEALNANVTGGLQAMIAREFAEQAPEMKIMRSLAWMTSSIALIIGAVGILNTMLMAVFERTRELAMMRAVGWRKSRVVRLVLTEALALAAVGAIVGAAGALLLTRLLSQTAAGGRIISGSVPPHVVIYGFIAALVLGLLGGLYPAYRAAQLQPIDGLRHD